MLLVRSWRNGQADSVIVDNKGKQMDTVRGSLDKHGDTVSYIVIYCVYLVK